MIPVWNERNILARLVDHNMYLKAKWELVLVRYFLIGLTLEECKDEYPNDKCERWKKFDECVTNKHWMDKNCRKTCDACKNQPPIPTSQTCANKLGDDACSKKYADGGCQMDRKYMFDNCQKVCKWCDKKSSKEIDTDDEAEIDGNKKDLRCIDEYGNEDKCKNWAAKGECRKNAVWMIPNCRKSCNKCKEDGVCSNLYDDTQCERWSRMRECQKNPTWMKLHCRRSCDSCDETGDETEEEEEEEEDEEEEEGTQTGGCRNKYNDDDCKTWAYHGHCDINPEYMHTHCAKACKKCKRDSDETDTATTTTTTTRRTTIFTIGPTGEGQTPPTTSKQPSTTDRNKVTCFDANENCPSWAKYGYCETNPKYNLVYCRLSCNNCNGCKDEQLFCKMWAEGGQCDSNSKYMLRKCQKSCGVCEK